MNDLAPFLDEFRRRVTGLARKASGRKLLAVLGLLFAGFVLFRLTGPGTHGTEHLIAAVKEELVLEAGAALREEAEALQAAGQVEAARLKRDAFLGEGGIDVDLVEVSIATPILSWGINETVVMRFDYTVHASGEFLDEGRDRYVLVKRWGLADVQFVRPSGPLAYYMNLLI